MKKQPERNNPFAPLSDKELESEWQRLVGDYIDRLEYFAGMPHALSDVARVHSDGPETHGVSHGEWREYLHVRLDHEGAAFTIAECAAERHRRLSDAARREVSALPDADAAERYLDAYRVKGYEPAMQDGETIRDYVLRRESESDRHASFIGACFGFSELIDREIMRAASEW